MALIEMQEVSVAYVPGQPVISHASLSVAEHEVVALVGESGSGKSTMLRVISGQLAPDSGVVRYAEQQFSQLNEGQRSAIRLRDFGFVTQFGDLITELTVGENIVLPSLLLRRSRTAAEDAGRALAEGLGVEGIWDRRMWEISGGQMQRVAIARALCHGPKVLLADEPTGALDDDNSRIVMDHLLGLSQQSGAAVVLVTHDIALADRAHRTVRLAGGRLDGAGRSS